MSDTSETRRVVLELFELFGDGTETAYGSDRFLDLIAENCDWSEESSDPRFAGRRGAKADLRQGVEQSSRTLRNRHAVVREIIAEGDRAAVMWTWSAKSAHDGQPHTARVITMFTVTDGQIVRWHDVITPVPAVQQ